MSKGLFVNGITTSEENYYFEKGYQQGRADAIKECIDILRKPNADIMYGFYLAVKKIEELQIHDPQS